jgi:glutathione peroxidase
LSELQEKYKNRGFSVLAFPTNDFRQEFDTNQEIQHFLEDLFSGAIKFPVFGTTPLRENPVYRQLQEQLPYQHVENNFFKYLVDRNDIATAVFHKKQDPVTLEPEIEKLLEAKPQ